MSYLAPMDGDMILGSGVCGLIVERDENGTIIYASPEAEKMFRVPYIGELFGKSVDELVPLPHKDLRLEFNKNPRVRRMGLGKPLSGRRRDGTTFPVEVELNPKFDPSSGRLLIRAYIMSMEGRTAILPVEKT